MTAHPPGTAGTAQALRRVRTLEDRLVSAWHALEDEIVVASDAGVSYSQIGQALGLSKQRVGDLAKAGRTRTAGTPYRDAVPARL